MISTVERNASEGKNQSHELPRLSALRVPLLETFVLLARLGKRTAVAEELGIEQGTVTKQIQELEIWAGAILVEHHSSPAELTPWGEEFLPKAQAILAAIKNARIFKTVVPELSSVSVSELKVPPSPAKPDKD